MMAAAEQTAGPSAPETPAPLPVTAVKPASGRYFVNTHALSLRKAPDASAALVTILRFKEEVVLMGTADGWGKVRHKQRNIVAWANMRYLQPLAVSQPTPAAPPLTASQTASSASTVTAAQKPADLPAPAASSPPKETASTLSLGRYFVNTIELSVRNGPEISAPRITTLNFKDEVELLETSGGWGKVLDPRRDIVGWSSLRYLQPVTGDGPREVSQHKPAEP